MWATCRAMAVDIGTTAQWELSVYTVDTCTLDSLIKEHWIKDAVQLTQF